VRSAVADPAVAESFIDLFESCNRTTVDELQAALVETGFYIAKVSLQAGTSHVPLELQTVPLTRLGISGIELLAIRH
jgi:hypothetical protein